MAAPNYPKNSSIYNLQSIYGINWSKNNKTLRQLGYTETDISFPAFNYFWKQKGWPVDEMLDLFLLDACWNDSLWASDTYYNSGYYIRPNFISQSRAWIQAPDGKYSLAFGCFTALGRYSGVHAQISSDAQGTMPGGTGLEINHEKWNPRVADRICMPATAWNTDYGVVGGLAYTEGVIIESFRFMGAKGKKTGNYVSAGAAMNDPGENSVIRFCMSEDFSGAGYMVYSGTPFVIDTCSAFYNDGPGFDLASSNGLNNIRVETPSGDCNKGGLIRLRPRDSQSVGGGTITVTNLKSESRSDESGGVPQVPIVIEGVMGDLNLTVNGMTANVSGAPIPYLIGGNWTGTQYEINANGIDLRSNTQALFAQGTKLLTGGKAYSGNSFIVNDEGLAFKSRPNMQLSGSGYTGTWQTGAWGPCVNGSQTRTVTCVGGTCDPATKPATSQACTVPPVGTQIPITITPTVSGTNPGGRELPAYAIDNDPNTVWTNGVRQDVADAFIQFDAGTEVTFASAVFSLPTAWANDYARTPQVYVGNNANAGSVVASTISGTSTMTVTFPTPVKGRYFRLTAKKTNGAQNWFTVGDAKFYKP